MKEWFKARNVWGAGIEALSDEEAGKFAKALWTYTMTGEKTDLTGAAAGLFAIAVTQLSIDDEQAEEISKRRSAAGSIGGRKRAENQANASSDIDDQANQANASFASNDQANQANDCNKNKSKNKNKNKNIDKESNKRFTPPTIDEVIAYCKERGNNVNPVRWFNFYESKGWKVGKETMKDWKASVRYWESDDNYGNNNGSNGNVAKTNGADYSFLPNYDVV